MDNKLIYATFEVDNHIQTATFAKDIDEDIVKNMHFDELRSAYEKCLSNSNDFYYCVIYNYAVKYKKMYSYKTEEEQKKVLLGLYGSANQIFNDYKEETLLQIEQTLKDMDECAKPIVERRNRVTTFLEPHIDKFKIMKYATSDGRILNIPYDIPDNVFIDIYYLFANAICNRFQFSEFDGKYREGLFHCLQFLDHKYHFQNFKIQYPNASEDEIEIYKRTNILDMITGRDGAYLEINDKKYICNAFLEKGCKFRIKIEDVDYLWNVSNGSKEDFRIDRDCRELWSCDDRFKVYLDPKNMAYYLYVYGHPDITIDEWFNDMDNFRDNYIYKQDSHSDIEKKDKENFKKGLTKIISNIKTKVQHILGTAYIIVNNNGKYYIPISKDERNKPEF